MVFPREAGSRAIRTSRCRISGSSCTNTRYRLERWRSRSGETLIGQLPGKVVGHHFGATLHTYILYQYHHAHVTQPLILEQLGEWGIQISTGEISAIITAEKDAFHAEKEALLQVGLQCSAYLHVDDTGARHQGKNGYCTHNGVFKLPPPRNGNHNGKPYRRRTPLAEPEPLLQVRAPRELGTLQLQLVSERHDSHLHNEYLDRYHYLGYQPLPGAQLRYFVRADQRIVALLGFGAAAWTLKPRDCFIGWTANQRHQSLHLLVNNARFLILPRVRCKNLASSILAMAARHLADDWESYYGVRPVLLETFVEQPRFQGTCYQAANWTYLGETRGRGKLDIHHQNPLPKKAIWVYPLNKHFRYILCR